MRVGAFAFFDGGAGELFAPKSGFCSVLCGFVKRKIYALFLKKCKKV
jgi:hypothetical protein